MKRQSAGKAVLIILCVLAGVVLLNVMAFSLWVGWKILHPGVDMAGGTSFVYEIDTVGLDGDEREELSERMAVVLRRRLDPRGRRGIVVRPIGYNAIEIQVPPARADTRRKREVFDEAMIELLSGNVDLFYIKYSLDKDIEAREEDFKRIAKDNSYREEILNELAEAYDGRKKGRNERDSFSKQRESIRSQLDEMRVDTDYLDSVALTWSETDSNEQNIIIERILGKDGDEPVDNETQKRELIESYFDINDQWAQTVDKLTDIEGLNVKYERAQAELRNFNITSSQIEAILDMSAESKQRQELLSTLKSRFPEKTAMIDSVITAYERYRPVKGILDSPEDIKLMLRGLGVLEFRVLPRPYDGSITDEQVGTFLEALETGPLVASDSLYVWCEVGNIETFREDVIVEQFGERYYVLASNKPDEVLLYRGGGNAWKLKEAKAEMDQMGRRTIGFTLNKAAGPLFRKLTGNNVQRPLCILLDNVAMSAPGISEAIPFGRGTITGKFSQTEQSDIINILNAGVLPGWLIQPPVSVRTIGPAESK